MDMINETAKIGAETSIEENTIIKKDVIIGNNCTIGHHVVIHEGTIIGNNVRIDDNTVIGKQPPEFHQFPLVSCCQYQRPVYSHVVMLIMRHGAHLLVPFITRLFLNVSKQNSRNRE